MSQPLLCLSADPRPLPTPGSSGPGDAVLAPTLDLAFSTHLTLVVPARIEFIAGDPHALDLVIARTHCRGLRPRVQAVLEAAQAAWTRTCLAAHQARQPMLLSARVNGQWRALCAWPGGAPALDGSAALGLR